VRGIAGDRVLLEVSGEAGKRGSGEAGKREVKQTEPSGASRRVLRFCFVIQSFFPCLPCFSVEGGGRRGFSIRPTPSRSGQPQSCPGRSENRFGQMRGQPGPFQSCSGRSQSLSGQLRTSSGPHRSGPGQPRDRPGQLRSCSGRSQTRSGQLRTSTGPRRSGSGQLRGGSGHVPRSTRPTSKLFRRGTKSFRATGNTSCPEPRWSGPIPKSTWPKPNLFRPCTIIASPSRRRCVRDRTDPARFEADPAEPECGPPPEDVFWLATELPGSGERIGGAFDRDVTIDVACYPICRTPTDGAGVVALAIAVARRVS
jgi:hypothetical protein